MRLLTPLQEVRKSLWATFHKKIRQKGPETHDMSKCAYPYRSQQGDYEWIWVKIRQIIFHFSFTSVSTESTPPRTAGAAEVTMFIETLWFNGSFL